MKSDTLTGAFAGAMRTAMRDLRARRRKTLVCAGALAAVALCFAAHGAVADGAEFCAAQGAARMSPAAWSKPGESDLGVDWTYTEYRGLGCERCTPSRHYCVINPMRNEYVCAPLGTTACISPERTGWCAANQTCWFGRCR